LDLQTLTSSESTATTSHDAVMSVRNLVKRYRKTLAVNDVTFDVPRCSVCGFLGPNGAGKTTTIGILTGVIPPTSGTVRVLGLNPQKQSLALRQRIGYVPDIPHIYKWMTIAQVFRFVAGIYDQWDWDDSKRIVGLLGLPMNRKVKELSRGESAKLSLTIALAHRPQLLVLDEPTTGLDPLVREEFLEMIRELLRNRELTVFFSTHILSDVDRIADRIIVMDRGRVLAQGPVEELRRRYTKASFLFATPPATDLVIPGAARVQKGVREWVAIFEAMSEPRMKELAVQIGASDCMVQPMSVEDIFLDLFNHHNNGK
jgi:ABC-2 type transport system ATP-binding protein